MTIATAQELKDYGHARMASVLRLQIFYFGDIDGPVKERAWQSIGSSSSKARDVLEAMDRAIQP